MSKYEETISGINRECPYCGYEYQVEAEDYTEDTYEEICEDCGMKYYACDNFTVDHYAKPDCVLNGADHAWEPKKLTDGRSHDFCGVCGKCR